ncbi:MAG: Rrf2 family transcriptional regulator [Terracidiphilus sp.]
MGQSGSSMQLTRAADYAVRVMIHLATLPPHERTLLPALAHATATPESFLSKILQALCRAELIASRRGKSGGFEILAAGREASIRSVIEAIDGPICLNICLISGASCGRKSFCPAHPIWASAQEAMLGVLNTARVADLAVQAAVPRVKGSTSQSVPGAAGPGGGRATRKRTSQESEAPALQSGDSNGLEIVAQRG